MHLLKLDDGRVIKVEELVLVSLDELRSREAEFEKELEKVREHIASHPDNKEVSESNDTDAPTPESTTSDTPTPQPEVTVTPAGVMPQPVVVATDTPQVVQPQVVNDVTPPVVQLS